MSDESLSSLFRGIVPLALLVVLLAVVAIPARANAVSFTHIIPGVVSVVMGGQVSEGLPLHNVAKRDMSVQEKLLRICEKRGYGESCAKALLGMMWKESSFIGTAIGDNGKARGYFQIHYRLHKIPIECAEDLECSAEWSLDYLESNGYPKYVSYAVQCHNGCNAGNGYAASALRHGTRMWSYDFEAHRKRYAMR